MNKILTKSPIFLIHRTAFLNGFGCQKLSTLPANVNPILAKKQLDWPLGNIQTTANRRNIHVHCSDPKEGYRSGKELSSKQHIINGLKQLKGEIMMWKQEMKEHFANDPVLIYRPGETDVVWSFAEIDSDITRFIATSDSDHNEGNSSCTFEKSPAGYGLFSGNLDSAVPQEGKLKRTGYCNIKSIRLRKSFQRAAYHDWRSYNTLVIRARGDGRPYMINLTTDGVFDITFHDMYQYALYTRGGPHWQTTKIPFSKFFLSYRGRIQDKQCSARLDRVSSVGITVAGLNFMDGAFSLEIDYIGLEYDPVNDEQFAYEMYRVPNFIVGT